MDAPLRLRRQGGAVGEGGDRGPADPPREGGGLRSGQAHLTQHALAVADPRVREDIEA